MNKRLHREGRRVFGPAWDEVRHTLVYFTTEGRSYSSKDLTPEEVRFMMGNLQNAEPLLPHEYLHRWADDERFRADMISGAA